MNTPTGGPWQSRSEYEPWLIIGNVDGEIHADGTTSYTYKSICEICDDDGDARDNDANRRLIIAAPDLLKAAERSLRGWQNVVELGLIPQQHCETANILADELLATIRKATGQ